MEITCSRIIDFSCDILENRKILEKNYCKSQITFLTCSSKRPSKLLAHSTNFAILKAFFALFQASKHKQMNWGEAKKN